PMPAVGQGYYVPTPIPTPLPTMPPTVAPPKRTGSIVAISLVALVLVVAVAAIAGIVGYQLYFATPAGPPIAKKDPSPQMNPPAAESVVSLVQLARDLRDREDYVQAEQRAREAVKLDPNSAPALAALADILLDQSKNSEAQKLADQALNLDRQSPTAHRVVGA